MEISRLKTIVASTGDIKAGPDEPTQIPNGIKNINIQELRFFFLCNFENLTGGFFLTLKIKFLWNERCLHLISCF